MSVLYDYFRAPSVTAVLQQMELREGGPLVSADDAAFDGVELKGIDPPVALGQLIGFVTDRPWDASLVSDRLIWPAGDAADEHMGPWVVALDDPARDALAGIPAERVPALAERWARIEEFGGLVPAADLGAVLADLIGLAGRARRESDSLFCWICL